jgi:ARG/rhodanese/phosphatase superfamily protein
MSATIPELHRVALGQPVRRDALTIVPLVLEPDATFTRDYIPLAEALERKLVRVTEVSDTGSVADLAVQNDSDVAILILDGEELLGARQNRIVNLSILVPPKRKLVIPVSCVEQGRWSYRTREFHVSPYTMFATGRADHMSAITMSLRSFGARRSDQRGIWKAVASQARRLGSASPTEAMYDAYETQRESLDRLLADLAPAPRQAGAIFAIGPRVVGAELFESPDAFAIYFSRIVRGYAVDALVEQRCAPVEVKEADTFLADLRRAPTFRFRSIGLGDDLRIKNQALTGGALLLDGRLVHLAAFRIAS